MSYIELKTNDIRFNFETVKKEVRLYYIQNLISTY